MSAKTRMKRWRKQPERKGDMAHRTWSVRVMREGRALRLGQVAESSESLARCAALSRSSVTEEELAGAPCKPDACVIYPDEDFDVTPAG